MIKYFYSILLGILFSTYLIAQDSTKVVKEGEEVFKVVEIMPAFQGGEKAMFEFLSKKIKYPEHSRDNGIQGLVIVSFIVEKDGTISGASIYKGVSADIDAEALRVVNAMPKWIPGTQRGKPVRVEINIPLRFTLK